MLFPTIEFGLFFSFSYALVWALNSRNELKKLALLALSLAFYASWNWRFLLLLFASALVSGLVGFYVDPARARPARKAVLALGVAIDLGILAYFKYLDFFIAQALTLFNQLGLHPPVAFVNVTLPVAISFLTFHAISYIVDVYRGRLRADAFGRRYPALYLVLSPSRRRPDRARARISAPAREPEARR